MIWQGLTWDVEDNCTWDLGGDETQARKRTVRSGLDPYFGRQAMSGTCHR